MTAQAKTLGKGLSVLMAEDYGMAADEGQGGDVSTVNSLPLDGLVSGKFQPRTRFTEEYLQELAASIRQNGIMQPILVRPSAELDGKYEIIAGERRWRAARLAGLENVPVIVQEHVDDKTALELALVENIQRQDLSPLEEAAGYQRLMDEFSYTQEGLASTVGKSRSHIANLLRLLALPDVLKALMEEDKLTMGHARALLNAQEPEQLAAEVVRRGLNVRQTENLVRTGSPTAAPKPLRPQSHAPNTTAKDPDIIALEETLCDSLGLKVSINDRGQSGEIVLAYESLAQLDDILKRLGGGI